MMAAESVLSKRPVLRIALVLLFFKLSLIFQIMNIKNIIAYFEQ